MKWVCETGNMGLSEEGIYWYFPPICLCQGLCFKGLPTVVFYTVKVCPDAVNRPKGKVQTAVVLIWVSETSPAPLFLHLGKKKKKSKFMYFQSLSNASFSAGFILFHVSCVEIETSVNENFWSPWNPGVCPLALGWLSGSCRGPTHLLVADFCKSGWVFSCGSCLVSEKVKMWIADTRLYALSRVNT